MTTKTKTTTSNTFADDEQKLSILISSRIRLSQEEKASLKAAYQKAKAGYAPAKRPSVNGSSLSVETSYTAQQLDTELGMNSFVFGDIVSSRETIPIQMVLRLQQVLGVVIVTPERLTDAFTQYNSFIFAEG